MLKEISTKEAQDIVFDLFRVFERLCAENGLSYFLSGGTLLGAARHGDFIPWDDDMDVMMPRADYDRLLALSPALPEGVELFSCDTDPEYNYPFAKLCDMRYEVRFEHHIQERSIGMYLDIFPIEGLPDGALGKALYFRRMRALDILRNAALRGAFLPGEKFIAVKRLIWPLCRRYGANRFARRMNAFARRYRLGTSGHAGVTMITHYGSREWMPADVFEPGAALPFREKPRSAPKGWDTYLRTLYGDYMQLPPEEQRHTDHSHFTIEPRRDPARTGENL